MHLVRDAVIEKALHVHKSQSRNTYRTREVIGALSWHPLFGSKLRLVKTAKITGGEELHCETPDGIVLSIPSWMTQAGCLSMEIGDPVVGVRALAELLPARWFKVSVSAFSKTRTSFQETS